MYVISEVKQTLMTSCVVCVWYFDSSSEGMWNELIAVQMLLYVVMLLIIYMYTQKDVTSNIHSISLISCELKKNQPT